ncbi:hypothetical protein YC2023_117558 [Brassica napus]
MSIYISFASFTLNYTVSLHVALRVLLHVFTIGKTQLLEKAIASQQQKEKKTCRQRRSCFKTTASEQISLNARIMNHVKFSSIHLNSSLSADDPLNSIR